MLGVIYSSTTIQDDKKKPLKPSATLGQFKYMNLNTFVSLISNADYKQFERHFQIRFRRYCKIWLFVVRSSLF